MVCSHTSLMKGMEGDADTKTDNKITARELHTYVEENVTNNHLAHKHLNYKVIKTECLYSLIRRAVTLYVY